MAFSFSRCFCSDAATVTAAAADAANAVAADDDAAAEAPLQYLQGAGIRTWDSTTFVLQISYTPPLLFPPKVPRSQIPWETAAAALVHTLL